MKAKLVPAARGLLRWSQNDLAEKAGLTRNTVNNLENEEGVASESLLAVETAFHRQGVIFLEDGVRKLNLLTEMIEGDQRLSRILHEAQTSGTELLINGGNEKLTPPAMVKLVREYREKGLKMRHLIAEGDTFIRGDVSEYRWVPKSFYTNQVRFIYGQTLAIAEDTSNQILLIRNADIAQAEKMQFDLLWSLLAQPVGESAADVRY